MKVLHLFSDWKWTGPAEPALDMVKGLKAQGLDVDFAVSALPFEAQDTVQNKALLAGVELTTGFHLSKHFNFFKNRKDKKHLIEMIKEKNIDLVHTHRHQDHIVGGMAARAAGIKVLRSSHEGLALKKTWRNKLCLTRYTDKYLPVSEQAGQADAQQFRLKDHQWQTLVPAIDADLFDPAADFKDMKTELNIPTDKVIVGIVARMQKHRHFEDLLMSWKALAEKNDNVHFVIVGRGTNMNSVAVQPVKELGLEERVTFAGYHRETYIDALNMFDVKVFLVPGSDGSCRALRQAQSLGQPAVVADRGMLAELVSDGATGFVTDGSVSALVQAQLKLIEDESLRKKMGLEARKITLQERSLEKQSLELTRLYEELLA